MQTLKQPSSFFRIAAFTLLLPLAPTGVTAQTNGGTPRLPLVVLADPDDAFLPLAREIAASERAPLTATPSEALTLRPDTVVWVVSPSKLSDGALVDYGLAAARAGALPALGFITGSSLERARSLYGRSLTTSAPSIALVSGNWRGHRETIRYLGAAPEHEVPLNTTTFRRALKVADELFYRGHGGSSYLRFNDSVTFAPDDVPARVPRLIATYACSTFRPWTGGRSISMALTDAGAAAYVGYSYSPLPGFQMTDGFPFRHTWPAFPVGRLVQLQSAASMRGLFAFPVYHLLGNPRLSVGQSAPYRVVADRTGAGARIIDLADAPRDALPIHIDGGAAFETTEVSGLAWVWRRDPFYNGRLQVLDVGADRYLLLQHAGGPLTIRLSMDRPLLATVGRTVVRGLDLCLVAFPAADPATSGAFAVLGLGGITWGILRRKWGARTVIAALALGGVFALCHVIYAVYRASRLDVVSSFDGQVGAWMFGATWILVSWGGLRYALSRTWKGRILGVVIAVLNVASMVVAWLGWPLVFNRMISGRLGSPLYGVRTGLLTLIGAAAIAALCTAAFIIGNKLLALINHGAATPPHGHSSAVTAQDGSSDLKET